MPEMVQSLPPQFQDLKCGFQGIFLSSGSAYSYADLQTKQNWSQFLLFLGYYLDINIQSKDLLIHFAWHRGLSPGVCCNASLAVLIGTADRRKEFVFSIISFLHLELKSQELTGEILRAVIRKIMRLIKSDKCPLKWTTSWIQYLKFTDPWRERGRWAIGYLGGDYHILLD